MSEWKIALAAWATLAAVRFIRQCGRMKHWERLRWDEVLVSRLVVVLLAWGGLHVWRWAAM